MLSVGYEIVCCYERLSESCRTEMDSNGTWEQYNELLVDARTARHKCCCVPLPVIFKGSN